MIGALKVAFTHVKGQPTREDGDDAFLDISINLSWDLTSEKNEITTLKLDKLDNADATIE